MVKKIQIDIANLYSALYIMSQAEFSEETLENYHITNHSIQMAGLFSILAEKANSILSDVNDINDKLMAQKICNS